MMNEGVGDRFQKETKYYQDKMNIGTLDFSIKPETYKEYKDCKTIILPVPKLNDKRSFNDLLLERKSVRRYLNEPISLEELSYILWASTGLTREGRGIKFRTAPSAGALYPIETYILTNRVEGLEKGIYHYSIKDHLLEELKRGDFGEKMAVSALSQKMCSESAVVFVWTAIFFRSKWKYKERAYRYIYLDCGHIAENLALASCNLGLGSCQIGALFDDEVNKIIGVDGTFESVIYMSVVGRPV
ncbi:MAG: SagB/ThcOx family dehydrogenase [Halobacteriota archaeon]|nr:SagB/ThcOx family dehydrogenase [Halobacteriota archaeon]